MHRTQIYLTETEREQLVLLARETGQSQSYLIREAIDQFITSMHHEKRKKKHIFKSAAGLWADRDDLPDFETLRAEFDR